jgi:ABC-2 type transport system ATP-binding protein
MSAPVVVEVRGLHKAFRVPERRVDTIKERLARPFHRVPHRTLHALRDVSFDVRQGEFFGIVGRNGSGKSTLLKVLASIYAKDAGTVRTAGRIAPFIELGVGFNPEHAAGENIVLNGVLMGLSRREAERRRDAVLDFAELRDFAELKVKNYSSGMMVRLAFAIMVEADADTFLVDEVLAVGDAAFQQKCADTFEARRREGRTVVLVTHDMTAVTGLCDRALLLHDGEVQADGEPEEVAIKYLRRNFGGDGGARAGEAPEFLVALRSASAQGAPLEVDVALEARRDLDDAEAELQLRTEDGVLVGTSVQPLGPRVPARRTVRVRGRLDVRLAPGRHFLDAFVRVARPEGGLAVQGLRLLAFDVAGEPAAGVVDLDAALEAVVE